MADAPISMSKRKQNDFVFSESSSRMRKVDVPSSSNPLNSCFYFFIRMMNGSLIYIPASPRDTIMSIHKRVELITGIPITEQRLIYQGKQLQWEQTLGECHVEKDVQMHLVGRMRSIRHPKCWRILNDLVRQIVRLIQFNYLEPPHIKLILSEFLAMSLEIPSVAEHMHMFNTLGLPLALVMLYVESGEGSNRKEAAEDAITHFLTKCMEGLPKRHYSHFVPVVLEFCKLLNERVDSYDVLYRYCRTTLGRLLQNVVGPDWLCDMFPFVNELAEKVCQRLTLSVESGMVEGPNTMDIADLSAMLGYVTVEIGRNARSKPIELPLCKVLYSKPKGIEYEITTLHAVFVKLLTNIDKCLVKIEELVGLDMGQSNVSLPGATRYFLKLLKELHAISKLYRGCNDMFLEAMKRSKHAVRYLLYKYAQKTENHEWITECEEVSIFEVRRHLAMLMLPGVTNEYDDLLEMLIDRSQLLEESFEYVMRADLSSLRAGLSMEFKNEEATGPGVLREWFLMVFQEIFNPQKGLFVACPNDRRRFYLNPESKADPKHLDYFKFSGRVIALAFMYKLQVGILLDRVLIAQLAGRQVTLEDIKDADPYLYSSWKQILEMDPEVVDQDVLGLTFVDEFEELGVRKSVELCHDGDNMVVNSTNRMQYISSLIQHRFVRSICEQVWHFSRGFADIVNGFAAQRSFFRLLHQEDLDLMLHGSENEISVDDWKAHTYYKGFAETDSQISWFWKVVGKMTGQQKNILLYFWTSIKYLPMEGFSGLPSRLCIIKTLEPVDRLPSSHTCFHQLFFPAYPSFEVMEARLSYISQDHVGCSFGIW